jgi:hypothetical protein
MSALAAKALSNNHRKQNVFKSSEMGRYFQKKQKIFLPNDLTIQGAALSG